MKLLVVLSFLIFSISATAQMQCQDHFAEVFAIAGVESQGVDRPVAYITGTSSGIGEALAYEYAKQGYDLVITARRMDKIQAVAESIAQVHPKAKVVAIKNDVTKEGEVHQSVRITHEYLKTISIVIANAGMSVSGDVADLPVDEFKRQFDTNVWGMIYTVQATIEDVRFNRGRVALVGSVIGDISFPGNSPYGMSKFAVRALADSLRAEEKANGVKVVHIQPGFIATEFRRKDDTEPAVVQNEESDWVPTWMQMPAGTAAKQIFKAVKRGQREKILTAHGKIGVSLSRYAPGLMAWVKGFLAKKSNEQNLIEDKD